MSKLLSTAKLGPYTLNHRVVLAPLTRMRAGEYDIPTKTMTEYYEQRASEGGFLVSEATSVSPRGRAYLGAAGIYTDEQMQAWKPATKAVHAKGGRIFLQLWHGGRQSHVDNEPNGELPVAPSAIKVQGAVVHTAAAGWTEPSAPRALRIDEIPAVVEEFRKAAERAVEAGFDGVELHAANGYLPDQFLQDGSNHRSDAYGGPIENRARFLLEVVEAMVSVWGGDRVGVRLSPSTTFGGMWDSDPMATFGYVATQLNRFGLAYLHVIEPRVAGDETVAEGRPVVAAAHLRKFFKGTLIAAGGFNAESAEAILQAGDADLVAFGRHFIANPDLPERIRRNLPLNKYNRDTFYGGGAEGYVDYPFYKQDEVAA